MDMITIVSFFYLYFSKALSFKNSKLLIRRFCAEGSKVLKVDSEFNVQLKITFTEKE